MRVDIILDLAKHSAFRKLENMLMLVQGNNIIKNGRYRNILKAGINYRPYG
jgi:hypothetical protein